MFLKQVEVGMMQNFNYLIGCPKTKECAVIDPAWEPDKLVRVAKENGYNLNKILLTHNHFDHIDGVPYIFEKTKSQIYIHKLDSHAVEGKGREIVYGDSMGSVRCESSEMIAPKEAAKLAAEMGIPWDTRYSGRNF